jgi:hypothetical protein
MQFKVGDIVEYIGFIGDYHGFIGPVVELYNEDRNLKMTRSDDGWIMGPNYNFKLVRRPLQWKLEWNRSD